MRPFVNIPIDLCEFTIRKRFYRPLQLFIYLKTICSGKIRSGDLDLQEAGNAIGLSSVRAVKNNLNKLKQENWIGFNKKSNYYFIRGFDKIREQYGFKARGAVEFEILSLKAFIAAAIIAKLINSQKRKRKATERVKGRSNHIACLSSIYFPVANKGLAKILSISISTAYELKLLAEAAGYISIKKTFIWTGIQKGEAPFFKRGLPELANKVKTETGEIRLQGIDQVSHRLRFDKRKKLETSLKGKTAEP